MNRTHLLVAAGLLLALSASLPSIANRPERGEAAPGNMQSIVAPGPIAQINIGADLSCQFAQSGVPHSSVYPASLPLGDCGTLLALGTTLYAPDFSSHAGTSTIELGTYTPFTPVSQSAVTGSGSGADPYRVVTVADAGATGLRVTQTDSYVAGADSYSTSVQVENTGAVSRTIRLYRVANCYLNGTNWGYGAADAAARSVACATSPSASDAGPVLRWSGSTLADHYQQGSASTVWSAINTGGELNDSCNCAGFTEHALALSWTRAIAPGGTVTIGSAGGIVEVQPLTVTKTADSPSTPAGGTNGYTITVSNPNAFDVTIETVEDALPAGFSYISGSTSGLTAWDPGTSGQTLEWWEETAVPGGGSVSLSFDVTVSSTPGMYTNNANATSPAVLVNPASDTAPVEVLPIGTPTPTATSTPTLTPLPPTPTNTVAPTATATSTPAPPTATPTNTAAPPTPTATNTPAPPTATPTNTPVPPTATATNTPAPPTATPTNTPVPPTPTATNTPAPPTATPTNTPAPPTATPTRTNTPISTATSTPKPPTATPTSVKTAVPTATPTPNYSACADFNGDGGVGWPDVVQVIRRLGARRFEAKYDLNGDGRITGRDLTIVIRQVGRRC